MAMVQNREPEVPHSTHWATVKTSGFPSSKTATELSGELFDSFCFFLGGGRGTKNTTYINVPCKNGKNRQKKHI